VFNMFAKIILGLIYFAVITPMALVYRLMRRDPLDRKYCGTQQSYWVIRATPIVTSNKFLKQFISK